MAKLVSVGNNLTKTYRDMANHGSTFGGSLLEMARLQEQPGCRSATLPRQ
jgi:hypothetical protein